MVVLPQPDSPTSPNVDPTGTAKDTSATADTCPTFRWSTAPAVTVKFFTRRETVSSGASTFPSATGLPPRPPASAAPLAAAAAAAAGDGATSGRSGSSDTNGVDGSCTSSLEPTGK